MVRNRRDPVPMAQTSNGAPLSPSLGYVYSGYDAVWSTMAGQLVHVWCNYQAAVQAILVRSCTLELLLIDVGYIALLFG